ncbi:MAG TPA: histidine phosphatase family protein [Saprospiraceae bacterium]|nr:histidine phosphatase family protein [Saprospiraceae bacterium]
MTLYILRHGQTELNRLNIVQGSGVDSELNEMGYAQARAFYEAHQHVDFELVVTSKLRRTHQTVQQFIERDIPWEQTADVNEISWGIHEGQPMSAEQNERYQRMIASWRSGDLDASIEEGESARQLLDRIERFVEWVKTRPEKKILVATHGRAIRCLITHLKGLPASEMESADHTNTGLYVAHYIDGRWEFELENDTSHLMNL